MIIPSGCGSKDCLANGERVSPKRAWKVIQTSVYDYL